MERGNKEASAALWVHGGVVERLATVMDRGEERECADRILFVYPGPWGQVTFPRGLAPEKLLLPLLDVSTEQQ